MVFTIARGSTPRAAAASASDRTGPCRVTVWASPSSSAAAMARADPSASLMPRSAATPGPGSGRPLPRAAGGAAPGRAQPGQQCPGVRYEEPARVREVAVEELEGHPLAPDDLAVGVPDGS